MRTIVYKLVNPIIAIIQETNTEKVKDVIELQMHLILFNDVLDMKHEAGEINFKEWAELYDANMNTIEHISKTLYRRTYNVEDLLYYYKQLFK